MNGITRAQHALFSGTRQDDDSGAGDGKRLLAAASALSAYAA